MEKRIGLIAVSALPAKTADAATQVAAEFSAPSPAIRGIEIAAAPALLPVR